jgi:hypothetical protein
METDFDLDLGDDVDYRVRVARRGDNWLLCFWPDPEIEPPVWRARSAPPVRAGDGRCRGGVRRRVSLRLAAGPNAGRLPGEAAAVAAMVV